MFEHCWLIVLRGKMLRRLPAGYFVEIVSHRHLRYGSGLCTWSCSARTSLWSRCVRASSTTSCSGCSSPSSCARGVARAAALLRARHLGDGRLALELPAPWRARDVGPGRRDAVMEVDEHVRASLIKTHGNLYRGVELTRYPIPSFPLPDGRGRALLDVGCNWGRWTIAAARAGWRPTGIDLAKKSVGPLRGAWPDSSGWRPSTSSRTHASCRSRTGRSTPSSRTASSSTWPRRTCRGWSRRFAGCCAPPASSGSRCRTRGER